MRLWASVCMSAKRKEWYNMPVNLNDEIQCGEGYELEFKLVSYVDCMKCLT